jgi:hypothetical protein
MCRYACDLQPMLKVLAGHEHIDKLLNIHNSVRFNNNDQRSLYKLLVILIKNHSDDFCFFFY